MRKIKLALHWQMGIALLLGVACGIIFADSYCIWYNAVKGLGQIFLRAINMIVIPLVFLSTVLGISTMKDSKNMRGIALKTFAYFVITALIAAVVGLVITNLLRPGYGTHYADTSIGTSMCGGSIATADDVLNSAECDASLTFMDKLVNIIPDNIFEAFSRGDILPIIFFSILLGYFITKVNDTRQNVINSAFESFNDVVMNLTKFIIRFAPLGVFAIVMELVGKQAGDFNTLKESFMSFAFFVIVVWISLLVMGGVILPLMVGLMAKVSPLQHLKQIYSALLIAFSTSSSYSALPLIISDSKNKIGVSNNVASFTIPLGITFNKVGTIIYECAAVIFVAQAVGLDLTIMQQVSLIGASIVTVLGAPSVPMAGVVVLAILLNTMGLPTVYIGMFMAIDILCDMPKTLLNAYSVSCSAIIVARYEGESLKI